jgi:Flp pilus assembly protein TadD
MVAAVSLFAFTATSPPPKEFGRTDLKGDRIDAAMENFDKALQYDPNDAEAYYLRGVAKLKRGDTAGGEADIAKAVALDPKYAQELSTR